MLRYWTAGESHGKALLALIDGFPAGLTIDQDMINHELRLRQGGYGRGGRQKLEQDTVDILTGVWQSVSLGSPIALQVVNSDYKLERLKELERPRPGHADLTGSIKFLGSIRGVLERSSARETAVRVAAGALARQLLSQFGIETIGYVLELGAMPIGRANTLQQNLSIVRTTRETSSIYSVDPSRDREAEQYIDQMAEEGDTLGGIIEVRVDGLPFGLGTHAQWDRKLDGKLAQAVMAVQAIKGVEIGMGFEDGDAHALLGEQQPQNEPCRPAADDTAGRLVHVLYGNVIHRPPPLVRTNSTAGTSSRPMGVALDFRLRFA